MPQDRAEDDPHPALSNRRNREMRYWIEPHRKSGIFRICWTENRVKRTKSLGTTDRREAERQLAEFLDELVNPSAPLVTVADVLDRYERDRDGHVVDIARIRYACRRIRDAMGWVNVADLRPSHSRQYIKDRSAAPGTINRELKALRAALKHAHDERLIDAVPAIRYAPKPAPKSRWLTDDEVNTLLDHSEAHHIRLFIVVALHTAARSGAILGLTWDRVDFDRRLIDFGAGNGKKSRARVPISDLLLAELRAAQEIAQTGHVIEYNGAPVKRIIKGFKRSCERAGLPGVTPHTLRHTAATWMAQRGVEMRKISLMLGHTSVATTEQIYAHHSPDYLSDAVGAISGATQLIRRKVI